MNKKALTEADIRTKFITPALAGAGGGKWDLMTQLREEVYFTKGRVLVRGKTVKRGEAKKADYLLFYKPGIPIAVIEAKDNNHRVGDGMQQALEYAEILDVPFAYSSNGDGFLEHDRTGSGEAVERAIPLAQFPAPDELWRRFRIARGYTTAQEAVASQDYYDYGTGKSPRYYQLVAVNRTIDAIARGENRILLVMATGTGKTYTAFQIIWRLWKSGAKKRILFLVDRNILADQTKNNDFKPFGKAMTKITNRTADKAYEIYLSLYQAVSGTEEEQNIYKQFSPEFFDLIVVDECHRGSAAQDAAWRKILTYFSAATQIGLTATPKETRDISNIEYFGNPLYTYSLRQGIADGFLAPYKVVRIGLDRDLEGWRPEQGKTDKYLGKTKSGRASKNGAGCENLSEPFELPSGWSWSRFPELGEFGRGKSKHRPHNDRSLFVGGNHRLVQTGDVARANGTIQTYSGLYNDVGLAQSKMWPAGTLCITIAANIADSGILKFNACFPDSVVGFNPASPIPSVHYFEYFMRTAKEDLEQFAPATAQKNINLGILEQVLIPLPPLAEQRRIVAKVDQLMALVDQLETQLADSRTVAANLLDALVAELSAQSRSIS